VARGPCVHVTLVPKWNSVADMGHEDRVSSYTCESCGQSFTAAEGRALRETEADRLRQLAATQTPPGS
jgi:transposase-like protein